jgi:hypothetical protein
LKSAVPHKTLYPRSQSSRSRSRSRCQSQSSLSKIIYDVTHKYEQNEPNQYPLTKNRARSQSASSRSLGMKKKKSRTEYRPSTTPSLSNKSTQHLPTRSSTLSSIALTSRPPSRYQSYLEKRQSSIERRASIPPIPPPIEPTEEEAFANSIEKLLNIEDFKPINVEPISRFRSNSKLRSLNRRQSLSTIDKFINLPTSIHSNESVKFQSGSSKERVKNQSASSDPSLESKLVHSRSAYIQRPQSHNHTHSRSKSTPKQTIKPISPETILKRELEVHDQVLVTPYLRLLSYREGPFLADRIVENLMQKKGINQHPHNQILIPGIDSKDHGRSIQTKIMIDNWSRQLDSQVRHQLNPNGNKLVRGLYEGRRIDDNYPLYPRSNGASDPFLSAPCSKASYPSSKSFNFDLGFIACDNPRHTRAMIDKVYVNNRIIGDRFQNSMKKIL